jgi:ABC-type nitrate/sulfonate/bicarbonate transport system substrate-binding protein
MLSIRIINTAGNGNLILQDLLQSQGILGSFGLAATHANVADGAKATEALLAGAADVCMLAGFGPLLPEIEAGTKLKVIGGGLLLAPQAVYARDPAIRELKDLVGRTVGTGVMGAALHQKMVALLRKKGIDPASVRFVNVGSTVAVFKAVVAGTVDAGPADLDVYADQARYGVHSLVDGNMWTELTEYTSQASYATDAAIALKRDAIVRALAAYAKVFRFVQDPASRDAWVAASARVLKAPAGGEPDPLWKFFQSSQPFPAQIALSPERVRYIQALNVTMGLQKAVLPFAQVADMSLAAEALKRIG